jgi:hypothetical protein
MVTNQHSNNAADNPERTFWMLLATSDAKSVVRFSLSAASRKEE